MKGGRSIRQIRRGDDDEFQDNPCARQFAGGEQVDAGYRASGSEALEFAP